MCRNHYPLYMLPGCFLNALFPRAMAMSGFVVALCPETVSPNPKPGISTEVKSSIDDAPYVIPQLLASQCSNCRQAPLLFYI